MLPTDITYQLLITHTTPLRAAVRLRTEYTQPGADRIPSAIPTRQQSVDMISHSIPLAAGALANTQVPTYHNANLKSQADGT